VKQQPNCDSCGHPIVHGDKATSVGLRVHESRRVCDEAEAAAKHARITMSNRYQAAFREWFTMMGGRL
jgi:hypothetical protein